MSTCTTYRQLQPEECLTIASLRQQGKGIRAIARTLGRSPCTVSREIARNSVQGSYASIPAQLLCQQRRIHARPLPKLHPNGALMGIVHYFLRRHWSPQQIALILATLYPQGRPLYLLPLRQSCGSASLFALNWKWNYRAVRARDRAGITRANAAV